MKISTLRTFFWRQRFHSEELVPGREYVDAAGDVVHDLSQTRAVDREGRVAGGLDLDPLGDGLGERLHEQTRQLEERDGLRHGESNDTDRRLGSYGEAGYFVS